MNDADPRIAVLQEQLLKVDLIPSERDALADELKTAHDINGDTAPVMQTLKTMLIQNVRRELISHGKIKSHFANCVIAGAITEDKNGKKVMPWVPDIQNAVKAITDTQKIDTDAATSSVSIGKWLTFKGPIAKYAAMALAFFAYMYFTNSKHEEALKKQEEVIKKNLQEKFVPEIIEAVKKAAVK